MRNLPNTVHQVTAPETNIRFWILGIYALHKVGTVEVAGCFAGNDVVFQISELPKYSIKAFCFAVVSAVDIVRNNADVAVCN